MKKTPFFFLIALALLLCLFPVFTTADGGQCGDDLTWSFDAATGNLTITGSGKMYDFEYQKQPWFSVKDQIKALFLPDGLTNIGQSSFRGSTNLSAIAIPNGVKSIGFGAFAECSSLTSVTVPSNVSFIGPLAFGICPNLKTITVESGNSKYVSDNGILFSTDKRTLVAYTAGKMEKTYSIPNGVTNLYYGAFSYCKQLSSINIPSSVTEIGICAFSGCRGLSKIILGNNIVRIDKEAFSSCTGLTSITIPISTTVINDRAFINCTALKDVYYKGTREEKEQIEIGDDNDCLLNAAWWYNGEAGPDPIDPPTITAQPKDVNVTNGEQATFTVKATGEGNIEYQWFSRPNANADWALVDGATNDTYTVVGTQDKNGWQFCCRVKNEGGEVYSIAATLTVTEAAPPTIKTQPKNSNVKSGSKAKFTVKVKEKGVTFQWFSKAPGAADWAELPGETKGTLTVVASKANSGTQYRCRVRNAEGGEVYTNPVTLTVKTQAPVIKTQPKSLTAKSGKKVKLSVKATGPKLTYTWYSRPNAEAAWTPVAGQTKNSLSVVASKANDGSQYYCHIQNADGEVDSMVMTLTVTPEAPTIKTQPKDAKVKIGAKAKFKVKAKGKNVTYQWYYRTSETGEWVLMEGKTSDTLTVIATEGNIGWQFRCQAKNADGQVYSKPATLRQK